MIRQLPVHHRAQAVDSLYFEAQCRIEAREWLRWAYVSIAATDTQRRDPAS